MNRELPATTLEQWFVLQTVVEEGSFAKAAERLHRSQSAVSYALSALQERLGIELLHNVGRRADLTDLGRVMLAQAQPLLVGMRQLEARAQGLQAGSRASVSLVLDAVFPKGLLFAALKNFQREHPQVQVHVSEALRTESVDSLEREDADLYLIVLKPESAHLGNFLMSLDFVAVAHTDHPLHRMEAPLTTAQLDAYPLVMLADRVLQKVQLRQMRSIWSFSTIEAAIEAVVHGVGYGWLPLERVSHLLQNGVLKTLPVATQQLRKTPLYLVYGHDAMMYDPTVNSLAEHLRAQVNGRN